MRKTSANLTAVSRRLTAERGQTGALRNASDRVTRSMVPGAGAAVAVA
nr:hypothetical protein BJQ95_03085 [Cryobacterium sp. SO1]